MDSGVGTVTNETRFSAAIEAIDAVNREDPRSLEVHGEVRPKELAHAELVTEWVRRLRPDASEALLLAARAHHIRRWEIPRDQYPTGRSGYLRWRKALQRLHATIAGDLLRDLGYDGDIVARVQNILQKHGLDCDPEVQTFEDALCLTFLETQLSLFSEDHPGEKAREVLAKTLRKMSPAARDCACALPVPAPTRGVLLAAARALAKS